MRGSRDRLSLRDRMGMMERGTGKGESRQAKSEKTRKPSQFCSQFSVLRFPIIIFNGSRFPIYSNSPLTHSSMNLRSSQNPFPRKLATAADKRTTITLILSSN